MGGSSIRTSDRQLGTRKTAGDRQLLDWAEGMGLLSTVNGPRPGEPRPGYYLFALRVGEWERPPAVGLASSIRQPVGLGRLPRCDAELNGVQRRRPSPFINSGGAWSVEAARATASWFHSSHPPHPPSSRDFALPHAVR